MWVLAASWVAGGPGDAPAYAAYPSGTAQGQVIYYQQEYHGPFAGLRQRLHDMVHGQEEGIPMQPGQVIQTGFQGQMMMVTSEPPQATPAQSAPDIKKEYQKKVGAADDYSWVTGQLFYLHTDGGVWVVRYAPVSENDRFGGSVVLASAVNMKNFREGDLVCVTGELLSTARASSHLGGAPYRATHIEMIDRCN
jgi:hypothetical protein